MLAHSTQENQEPVQNNDGSGEIGLSVSILHWRRHASLSWLWRRDQRFCISKVKEKDFLNGVLHCNCKCMQQGCKRDLSLWISKQYRRPAFKIMYVQFCNEAKSCAYWFKNETIWYETEMRPRHLICSPIQDRDRDLPTFPRDRGKYRDVWKLRLETISRLRRWDRDYIPDAHHVTHASLGPESTQPKWHLSRFSHFCTAHGRLSSGMHGLSSKIAPSLGTIWTHI